MRLDAFRQQAGQWATARNACFAKRSRSRKIWRKKINLTEWSSCDVDAIGLAAADLIEAQAKEIDALRNELCLKCGKYTLAHEGACNGCRWRR